MPLSFTPGADERVLLRGGFGGVVAWVWLGMHLFIALATALAVQVAVVRGLFEWYMALPAYLFLVPLLVIAALPWLLSARWALTTRRLIYKLPLRSLRELPLDAIAADGIRPGWFGAWIKIPGPTTLRLWFTGHIERLWGGILLAREPAVQQLCLTDVATPEMAAVAVAHVARVEGLHVQPGVCVLRPGRATFLPSEAGSNVALTIAGGLAGTALHLHRHRYRAQPPLDLLRLLFQYRSMTQVVHCLDDLSARWGGEDFTPESATLSVAALEVGKRASIQVAAGTTVLQGMFDAADTTLALRLAEGWKPVPPGAGATRSEKVFAVALAMLPLGLCAVCVIMGLKAHATIERGFEQVGLTAALDRSMLPEGALVTVHGSPERVTKLWPDGFLLSLRGEGRLVLRCPSDHPLATRLVGTLSEIKDDEKWSGALVDVGEKGWIGQHLPAGEIVRFIEQGPGLAAAPRVLDLDAGLGEARFQQWAAVVFAPMWGLLAALLLWVTFRPRAHSASR